MVRRCGAVADQVAQGALNDVQHNEAAIFGQFRKPRLNFFLASSNNPPRDECVHSWRHHARSGHAHAI
jgi:hypothetical protein